MYTTATIAVNEMNRKAQSNQYQLLHDSNGFLIFTKCLRISNQKMQKKKHNNSRFLQEYFIIFWQET